MTRQVQALLLAAGSSQRFGSDKRVHRLENGLPIIVQALRNLQAAVAHVVLVIKPGETQFFTDLLASQQLPKMVEAATADAGMGASLACGISHIDADAVLVALADMPFIQPATIAQVAGLLREQPLVVPCYRGRPGHPVGFQRRFFAELGELTADEGGKTILRRHHQAVKKIAVSDPAILQDIDTKAGLTS